MKAWSACPGARLEQEAGLFFDMNYFERLMMAGDFDHADRYLSGFTKIHDDENSREIFLELRKQKYLEVLDRYGFWGTNILQISDFFFSFWFNGGCECGFWPFYVYVFSSVIFWNVDFW